MLPKNILETRRGRLTAFSLLYLSEGIPFGFAAVALVTFLRQQGVGLTEIGLFTASLYAPWGLKWAWAPLVDLVRPVRFGPRRFWIVLAQALMTLTLGAVILINPGTNLKLLTLLIVVHNVFAAMQDIAIDALAVQVLPAHERGTANGFMFGASYLGQAIGGSGALFVAGRFGFAASVPFVCATILLILIFVSVRIQEPKLAAVAGTALEGAKSAGNVVRNVVRRIAKYLLDLVRGFFLSGRGPVVGVAYALLPPGAIALGLALGSTMQVDLGMNEDQIAKLTLVQTIFSAAGCVIGGWVSDRLGHRKMLGVWVALTTLPTLWLSGQFTGAEGMEGVTLRTYAIATISYSFVGGLVYGTSTAVYMGLTSPIVAATQFSGYMAFINFVYAYSSTWQGAFAEGVGYAKALRLDAMLAIVPLLLLPFLRPATPEVLTGEVAARRLTKFAATFVLLSAAVASVRTDWTLPGGDVLALWSVVLVTLFLIVRGGRRSSSLAAAAVVAAVALGVLGARLFQGRQWNPPVQLAVVAAVFSIVAVGLLAAARYEHAKQLRLSGAT